MTEPAKAETKSAPEAKPQARLNGIPLNATQIEQMDESPDCFPLGFGSEIDVSDEARAASKAEQEQRAEPAEHSPQPVKNTARLATKEEQEAIKDEQEAEQRQQQRQKQHPTKEK